VFNDSSIVAAINYAVAQGAKIINMSLGGDEGDQLSNALRNAIVNATNAGVLVVIAAGNNAEPATATDPVKGLNPAEPAIIAGNAAVNGRVVAVGAVDASGNMAGFSNRAGSTQNFYLLAPGVSLALAGLDDDIMRPTFPTCGPGQTTDCNDANTDGNYWLASGTSFAAPGVAGALALMLHLFPNITPENALMALLVTADDYTSAGNDPIFGAPAAAGVDPVGGRGRMNLARAFSPIGTTTMSFGAQPIALSTVLNAP
jgi:subtilisin family serine protease